MKNTGTLVTSPIRPNDSLDPIASAFANEIKGGMHNYETVSERNAIIEARREWGMFTNVYNDGVSNGTYKLTYGYVDNDINNNSNWVIFLSGSGDQSTWINSVKSLSGTEPLSNTNGDRYLIDNISLGTWFGKENKIAEWVGSTWSYTTPDDGYALIVNDQSNVIYRYLGTYSTGTWYAQTLSGFTKFHIENETVVVPQDCQYFVYGDLTIGTAGSLINYGKVETFNGNLIIESTGTFSNLGSGTYESINPVITVDDIATLFGISLGTHSSYGINIYSGGSYSLQINLI